MDGWIDRRVDGWMERREKGKEGGKMEREGEESFTHHPDPRWAFTWETIQTGVLRPGNVPSSPWEGTTAQVPLTRGSLSLSLSFNTVCEWVWVVEFPTDVMEQDIPCGFV